MLESDIVYEIDDFYVRRTDRGDYEVYKQGSTHSTKVATIGKGLSTGSFERAKQEADRRASPDPNDVIGMRTLVYHSPVIDGSARKWREITKAQASKVLHSMKPGVKLPKEGEPVEFSHSRWNQKPGHWELFAMGRVYGLEFIYDDE